MRLSKYTLAPGLLLIAALGALMAAWIAAGTIEATSKRAVEGQLVLQGQEWVDVQVDGLRVVLTGTANSEATRFRALTIAGTVVDAARVVDQITVPPATDIKPPKFSIEILRNGAGISLIGLIPSKTDRATLAQRITEIAGETHVTDLMESAAYAVPDGWDETLSFALEALATLPRSKISMDAQRVAITAIADSIAQKRSWEAELARAAPANLSLAVNITAPRPVITPFTLRFLIDENGARFDACSAHTDGGRERIVAAATRAGMTGKAACTIGLGVPSPDWPEAVSTGIDAIKSLEGGSITFSDADVTLIAPDTTPQPTFDRVVGELEAALPAVFSLHAVLPEPVKIDGSGEGDGPPEFIATRSPEGLVQLRGRLSDERQRSATQSYARARFGVASVYAATRLDAELPKGWSIRVLAGLEALAMLSNGVVVVQPDVVDIRGDTDDAQANAEISRILSEKLGEAEDFRVKVTYHPTVSNEPPPPDPRECVDGVNAVLAESKITFAPGSANIDTEARGTIDKIAKILKECSDVKMEIGGHTDSQGREEMNQALSQSRAQAVLNALLTRRVLTSNLTAHGYGEATPIADNGTEEGREANRRIEFRLTGADDSAAREEDPAATAEGAENTDAPAPDAAPASDAAAQEPTPAPAPEKTE